MIIPKGNNESVESRIIGLDPMKLNRSLSDHPEIKEMAVGKSGSIPSSALVLTKSGDLYVCGTVCLNMVEFPTNVTIKRLSKDAFELDVSKMSTSDYNNIVKAANIEEAAEMFYVMELSDFIHLKNIQKDVTPLKRPDYDNFEPTDSKNHI